MTLEPHWIEYLNKLVARGRYSSREEALERALSDLLMRELEFADLKAAIQEGIDSGEAEEFDESLLDSTKRRGRERLEPKRIAAE